MEVNVRVSDFVVTCEVPAEFLAHELHAGIYSLARLVRVRVSGYLE